MTKKVEATKVATPQAVATPTKKATTDLYAKAWRTSYDKKAEVPQPVIFELVQHVKGPNGRKQYPISAFFEAREIIFDPGTEKRREIRYCKNEPSIYIEEQRDFSKSEILRFQNGVLVSMPNNPALTEFLRKSNLNKDNKNRISDTRASFFEIKPTVTAQASIEDEISSLDAISLALRAPLEKVMPIAKYLNINTTRAVVEIRQDLKNIASKNPQSFISLFDNKEVLLKGTVKTAEEYGVIKVTSQEITWETGAKIVGVPLGQDPYQALIDYLKEKNEFEKFKTTLENKLNIIINS